MILIADAESGTTKESLYPLSSDVEHLDVGVVTGSPSFKDVVSTLVEADDFESVVITGLMEPLNKLEYEFVVDIFGEDHIYTVPYVPQYYELRMCNC